MTKKEAKLMTEGDLFTVKIAVPQATEQYVISKDPFKTTCRAVKKDEILIFTKVIPKVRIVNNEPWQDGMDEMIFCKTQEGHRAWVGITNSKKIEKKLK